MSEVEGRLSVRGLFLVPAVDGLHLGDASVGAENHGEGNVHRDRVDVGVAEVPLVAIVKFRVETFDGLGLSQRNVAAGCEIVRPVSAISPPIQTHRGDVVAIALLIVGELRPCLEDVAILSRVEYFLHRHPSVDGVMYLLRPALAENDRHDGG
jgi:hypothetical protein